MDYNAIADALEAAVDAVPGINAMSEPEESLPNVAFVVGEMDIDFDVTFRRKVGNIRHGTDQVNITCRILVARFADKHALRRLRTFMSGSGVTDVISAISADRTLGGTVHDSQVKTAKGNRLFQIGEKRYYGIELVVFAIGDAG